jgi:hypothetical protein
MEEISSSSASICREISSAPFALFLIRTPGPPPFAGREGVRPQRARGLMWLTLAREAAIDSKKDKWIIDLYDKAVATAKDEDRQDALAYLADHLKRRN